MTSPPLEFPLADLTTTLVRDVFRAITDTAMEQADAYATLAGEVGMSVEAYQAKILGLTTNEENKTIAEYISNGVLPLLLLPKTPIPDPILFAEAQRIALLVHFARIVVDVESDPKLASELITITPGQTFPCAITRADLEKLVRAKILRDAAGAYARITTLLRTGLPNIIVTGGQINTKVTMAVTEVQSAKTLAGLPSSGLASSLGVRVRVANERSIASSKSLELVGSVRIDFRAGVFPSIDPVAAKKTE